MESANTASTAMLFALAPAGGPQNRVIGNRGQPQFLEPCSDLLAQILIWLSGLFGDAVGIKNLDGIERAIMCRLGLRMGPPRSFMRLIRGRWLVTIAGWD